MSEVKRITPEMVLEAYRETGLEPERGDYFPASGCACGMGAIAHQKGVTTEFPRIADQYFVDIYGRSYRRGFAVGFDGLDTDLSFEPEPVRYLDGYDDGRAAWEAVKHLVKEDAQ